jgi:hypothetical protein
MGFGSSNKLASARIGSPLKWATNDRLLAAAGKTPADVAAARAAIAARLSAPAPADPATLLGGTPPPDTAKASSAAQQAALAAGLKQRKKATGAGRTLVGQPIGRGMNPAATLQPRTLLGA